MPKSDPNAPPVLARLLAELAALPFDQRAALAALITPPAPAKPPAAAPDDRLPWEREQGDVDSTTPRGQE